MAEEGIYLELLHVIYMDIVSRASDFMPGNEVYKILYFPCSWP